MPIEACNITQMLDACIHNIPQMPIEACIHHITQMPRGMYSQRPVFTILHRCLEACIHHITQMPELGISNLVPSPPTSCLSLAVQKSTAVTEGWVGPGTRLMYVLPLYKVKWRYRR